MTALAGVTDGKTTWIGGDRQSTRGSLKRFCPSKLVRLDTGFVVGCTGYSLARTAIGRFADSGMKLSKIEALSDEIRTALKRHDFVANDSKNAFDLSEIVLLVAAPGKLWEIDGAGDIEEITVNTVWAAGSGAKIAIGAGNALLRHNRMEPGPLVVRASIEEACHWDAYCGYDIEIMEVK